MKHFLQASKSQEFDTERERKMYFHAVFFFCEKLQQNRLRNLLFCIRFFLPFGKFQWDFVPKMNKSLQK